jgi:hypothetical protein
MTTKPRDLLSDLEAVVSNHVGTDTGARSYQGVEASLCQTASIIRLGATGPATSRGAE